MPAQAGPSRARPAPGDGPSGSSGAAPGWDERALEAARAGDLRAWAHLVRRHQDLVFRTAWVVTRDSSMAEDATKAAFVRAFRSLRSLEPGASPRPWLMGITMGVGRSLVREAGRARDAKPPEPDPAPRLPALVRVDPTLPRPLPAEEAALHDAFDGLTDQDRVVLLARYRYGLRRSEAATLLAVPEAEVDEGLAATASRLRRRLEETVARGADTTPSGPAPLARLLVLSDDQLASLAVVVAFASPPWTPDVSAVVCDRLAREAAAYPDHRPGASGPGRDAGEPRAAPDPGSTSRSRRSARPAPPGGRSSAMGMGIAALVVVSALVGLAVVTGTPTPPQLAAAPTTGPLGILTARIEEPGAAPPGGGSVRSAGAETPGDGSVLSAGADRAAGLLGDDDAPPATVSLPDSVAPPMASQAPVAGPPAPDLAIVGSRLLEGGDLGARVSLAWPSAAREGAARSWLERKIDDGAWQRVAEAAPAASLGTTIRAGHAYRFRVRSQGSSVSLVSPTVLVALEIRDPRSEALALDPAAWETRFGNTIKSRLIATSPEASLSTAFQGNHVALVGPTGPTRGAFGVRIDGGTWTSDDLRVRDSAEQAMLFSEELPAGLHWLDLRAEAEGLAVDAVLILNTIPRPSAG
jgi:RNA polymerase sigma-70 factor, ECF subfamily